MTVKPRSLISDSRFVKACPAGYKTRYDRARVADDELNLPQVPEPKPEDPEDVSWALSTAEAMWARGDHAEGIKWVRRAAEAASEAESDARALELAKAAADLAGLLTRKSLAPPEELDVDVAV